MSNYHRSLSRKVVLLGESSVGKSSLVMRFVKGSFSEFQESTIGAAFLTQTLVLNEHKVKFEIWDTAGQERYHSLAPMYYRGTHAAVVVYDITSENSFERAKAWVTELMRQAPPCVIVALAGNKVDLEDSREVSYEDGEKYADKNGLIFYETSAKIPLNINEIFVKLAEKLTNSIPVIEDQAQNLKLDSSKRGKKCC